MTKTESERIDIVILEADIQDRIFQMPGLNVTMDRDLANLYAGEIELHVYEELS